MSVCKDAIDRIMVEVESLREMQTGCLFYNQKTNDKKNNWAIVFGFIDDTNNVYGKIAYQPKNSIMQCDFDVDWIMPYSEKDGVYDTETQIGCKDDIEYLFKEWNKIKQIYNL